MTEKQIIAILSRVKLPEDGLSMNDAVDRVKRILMLSALTKSTGNKQRAARLLNLNEIGMKGRMVKLGLLEFFPTYPKGRNWVKP